ncbi:MAG: MFS transporter [Alphaproteobacteria bacterium]|nr:MFS transporter [Alphaproteobacteria bacterium]
MATAGPLAPRSAWVGLLVLMLPCALYAMDLTVLNLAVPALSADLKPTSVQLLWIIDVYGFLVAGSLLTMGTLGDRIGRRRLLMIGAVAFAFGSLFAAFATSAGMLILARALLGIAGATVAPSTLSLIRNMFPNAAERSVAISIWISSYSAGAAIGPLVGGALLEFFWWGSVFLLNVPIMALVVALAPVLLPEYRDPKAGRVDLVSAAMSLVAVLAVVFGLKQMAQEGPTLLGLGAVALGIALGIWFVRRQRAMADPLIDIRLFDNRSCSAAALVYMLAGMVMFGGFVLVHQYLQLVRGLSPLTAGLWTLPWALAFIVGSMVTPLLRRRYSIATLMTAGLIVDAVGMAFLLTLDDGTSWIAFVAMTFVWSVGGAPVFMLANDIVIGAAPPERAGAAAGISETGAELGAALGVALLGTLGTWLYRREMISLMPPEVPAAAAAAARDTLGGAIAVAGTLGQPARELLVDTAREAFLLGLQVTVAVGVAVLFVLAVVAHRSLRRSAQPQSL